MCHRQNMVYGLWSYILYWESLQWVYKTLLMGMTIPFCGKTHHCFDHGTHILDLHSQKQGMVHLVYLMRQHSKCDH